MLEGTNSGDVEAGAIGSKVSWKARLDMVEIYDWETATQD